MAYRRSMSCIRFNTPAQRLAMRKHAPVMLTAEQARALHPAPIMTESKIQRLRLLASDTQPKIREAVAASHHTPVEVRERLARDSNDGVRSAVAKNETTPCHILRFLAQDASETVRGWVAVNYYVPSDVMETLQNDESSTVRSLVAWKATLAAETTV